MQTVQYQFKMDHSEKIIKVFSSNCVITSKRVFYNGDQRYTDFGTRIKARTDEIVLCNGLIIANGINGLVLYQLEDGKEF